MFIINNEQTKYPLRFVEYKTKLNVLTIFVEDKTKRNYEQIIN